MGKPQILRINDVLVPDFAALATSSSRHSGPLHKVRLSSLRIARSRSPPARRVGAEAVQRAAGASASVPGGGRGGGRPLRAPGDAGRAGEGGKPPRVPGRPVHIVLRTSGVSLNPDRRVHTPPWLGSLATSLLLECAGSLPHNTQSCHGAGDSGGRGVARRREVAGQRPAETRRLLRGVSLSHSLISGST